MAGLSWPARTLRGSLARLFLVAAMVMILAVAAGAIALVRLGHDRASVVDRLDPANVLVAQLLTAYVDQETGVRGYVLTAEPLFLQPYQQGQADVHQATTGLQRLLSPRSKAGELLAQVQQAGTAWDSQFAEPAVAATKAGRTTYATDGAQAAGKTRFDRLRLSVAALQSDLAGERTAANHRLNVAADVVVGVLLACLAVFALTALVVWRSLRRRVMSPLRAVSDDVRLVAAGDLSHQVRLTGPQEIADLASSVEAMRKRILTDVEAERAAQEQLSELNAELTRSNEDLEQFAYVASHDLQEPLRKVASFCRLLEERYQGTLDERADQYIKLAVDGATRMQTLVDELLTFSRVGRGAEPFAPVPLQECVDLARQNLAMALVEAAAEVNVSGPLPTINGNAQLLTSLFQNLISNAITFRSDAALAIRISATPQDGDWVLAVSDNGIGIDPRFAEKIFVVFQQLNRRDTYGGSGIGLAICKRIVEFHGGRIWLDVNHHPGARLCCTLPAALGEVGPVGAVGAVGGSGWAQGWPVAGGSSLAGAVVPHDPEREPADSSASDSRTGA